MPTLYYEQVFQGCPETIVFAHPPPRGRLRFEARNGFRPILVYDGDDRMLAAVLRAA